MQRWSRGFSRRPGGLEALAGRDWHFTKKPGNPPAEASSPPGFLTPKRGNPPAEASSPPGFLTPKRGNPPAEESFHDCHQQNRFEIKPPWRSRYDPTITHNLEHVFTLALPTRLPIQLHPKEHSDYDWLPREQAAEQASSYTNREAILKWVV